MHADANDHLTPQLEQPYHLPKCFTFRIAIYSNVNCVVPFLAGRFSVPRLCIRNVSRLSVWCKLFWKRYRSTPKVAKRKMKAYIDNRAQMLSYEYGSWALGPSQFWTKKLGPRKYALNDGKRGGITSICV